MPRPYSIGEFADELGVHAQTVKRWCRDDDLDYLADRADAFRTTISSAIRLPSAAP